MLDIHCHILPGVDDGPGTLEESLAVARFCVRDGITHVVATPHCHRHLRLLRADILPHVADFAGSLRSEGIRLEVLPGSEIQLTDVALYCRYYESGQYCHLGDDHSFTLLEFPWHINRYPAGAVEHIHWLLDHGTQPIIAHPERQRYFQDEPGRLHALIQAGAWLQITVDSLLGNHGPGPEQSGWDLLGTCHDIVLATDAHGPARCSGLAIGYRSVSERLGADRAEDLRNRAVGILQHLLAVKR